MKDLTIKLQEGQTSIEKVLTDFNQEEITNIYNELQRDILFFTEAEAAAKVLDKLIYNSIKLGVLINREKAYDVLYETSINELDFTYKTFCIVYETRLDIVDESNILIETNNILKDVL